MKGIFQEYRLKYVLRIRAVFQMYHAEPLNGIRIPLNCHAYVLLVPHSSPSIAALCAASSPEPGFAPHTLSLIHISCYGQGHRNAMVIITGQSTAL